MALESGTVVELLARAALAPVSRGGLVVTGAAGDWRTLAWRDVVERACQGADALARRGIGTGDRVAIAAANSLEWVLTDFATAMLGAVLVPLHASLSDEQLAWQVRHSGARLVISGAGHSQLLNALPLPLTEWQRALEQGNAATGRKHWQATQDSVTPDTLASIVYTSGTSGEPKGVMLTQGNLAANARAILDSFGQVENECRLNSLPFSHAYGRMSDLYVSLAGNTRLAICRGREMLVDDARAVQPTLLVVVPLLLARLKQATTAHFGPDDHDAVRKLLGGKVRGFVCGGAQLTDDLHEYFAARQTPVWEGYGLTEASPVVTLSSATANRRGSVGRIIAGEARIADDGELLIRGPHVTSGYWRDAPATLRTLSGSWLRTGDLATIDDEGFLVLQGRKKEFLVLTSGKKAWPSSLESRFAGDPVIEQIMVVGEGQDALGALVVFKPSFFPGTNQIDSVELNSPTAHERMLNHLASKLRDCGAHEQIRRVHLLAKPWTAANDELTPKLTLRRSVIEQHHADCIRQMFCDD